MGKPMTEERLAELRMVAKLARRNAADHRTAAAMLADAVDEIDRLRAENERLRPMVEHVLSGHNCNCTRWSTDFAEHPERCAVRRAYDALNPEPTS